ncbi:hypothetical protein VRC35_13980 [Erwinia aphidicola]|uniref:hypothetical protein n=1 Tax=Erwinia aphidicola TaxID=68334 RepID=UPI0030D1D827
MERLLAAFIRHLRRVCYRNMGIQQLVMHNIGTGRFEISSLCDGGSGNQQEKPATKGALILICYSPNFLGTYSGATLPALLS